MNAGRDALSRTAFAQLSCLESVSRETVAALAERARARHYTAGETVLDLQGKDRDLYFLIDGTVRITTTSMSGRELTYQLLHAGEMFGEIGAIDGGPRTASVVADVDAVIASLSQEDFLDLLRTCPDFATTVLQRLARVSRHLARQVMLQHTYKAKGRIIAEYLRIASELGNPFEVSDRDVASRVGTTRARVQNLRNDLVRRGLLAWNRPWITVTDTTGLEALLAEQELG